MIAQPIFKVIQTIEFTIFKINVARYIRLLSVVNFPTCTAFLQESTKKMNSQTPITKHKIMYNNSLVMNGMFFIRQPKIF